MKASLKIASLNMRGQNKTLGTRSNSKWLRMNQIMKEKNLVVLAVQEPHLEANKAAQMNTLFEREKRIVIENTQGNNLNAKGVAIILNKEKINTGNIITKEIIPGKAMSTTFKWHKNKKTHCYKCICTK